MNSAKAEFINIHCNRFFTGYFHLHSKVIAGCVITSLLHNAILQSLQMLAPQLFYQNIKRNFFLLKHMLLIYIKLYRKRNIVVALACC